jgi:predicted AlkP superfamily phosphohydrolase/phosphomutase
MDKVIVIGLDGLEPAIVEGMLAAGELPNLARLRDRGGYSRLQTTSPAQTPVAWSTFATGLNPGGHGIFDFLRRDTETYLPALSTHTFRQKNSFVPPQAVNLRQGVPVWEALSRAGIPSTVIRCPATFPPDQVRGRMLSGVGVPDLRGGLGTSTFYCAAEGVAQEEAERVVTVAPQQDGVIRTQLIGPRNPRSGEDTRVDITLRLEPAARRITLQSSGQPGNLELREGRWSDWLRVKFRMGLLQSVSGLVRFYLVRLEPMLELYASPVNFDPETPLFPISSPAGYAGDLAARIGAFYTTGMAEDHEGLNHQRFGEDAYLQQCDLVLDERLRMMRYELDRFDRGLFFCLFDTPDRVQHMFWRFREPDHPANRHHGPDSRRWDHVIEDSYRTCDAIIGEVLERCDDRTLLLVLSDHGNGSFQRGVHLNAWLRDNGFLVLEKGAGPAAEVGQFFQGVDWSRTQAYALGLGGIYLNLQGREAQGMVGPEDAERVKSAIVHQLAGLGDPLRGLPAVRGVAAREQLYSGPYVSEAPDLLVNFAPGYRVSWTTPLGGAPAGPEGIFEDNVKKWSGDHMVDPALAPGVLFMSRPIRGSSPDLKDLAPTILAALGVPLDTAPKEGKSLYSDVPT